MVKIKVTEKLIQVIKENRARKKLSARQLSEKLGKSISYISALECGKIEYLDKDMFLKIFEALSDEKIEFDDFMNNLIKNFIFTNNLKFNDLDTEKWIIEYYLIIRECDVSTDITYYIFQTLNELNVSIAEFVERINENRHLDINNITLDRLTISFKNNKFNWFYKLNVTEKFIKDLLNLNIKKLNYIYMFILLYSLFSFKTSNAEEIDELTLKYLYEYNFCNLRDIFENEIFQDRISLKNTSAHKNKSENLYVTDKSTENFDKYSELEKQILIFKNSIDNIKNIDNIDYCLKSLQVINKNFNLDFNFMIALTSLPFVDSNFKFLNFEQRQQRLFEIIELLKS